MLMWSSDPHKRGSMERICKALGIPGKGDFDGSMVAETWPVDRQKVIDYCKNDVIRTREMYKRMTFDW
jgi:predicted PolB exonuclease-like 3'-5' exonuclease